MGGVVPAMHHGSGCSAKTSGRQEIQKDEFNFLGKKTTCQEVKDAETEGLHLGRRVSPRLQTIPKEKQPFYGSGKRKKLSASKDEVYSRKTENDYSKRIFCNVEDDLPSRKAKIVINAGNSPQNVSHITSEGQLLAKRVSPRLKDIPAEKRPFYGSVQRRRPSASKIVQCDGKTQDNGLRRIYSFKDSIVGEEAKDETTTTKINGQLVQQLKSDRNLLKQQISPIEDRPLHGSNQKRKLTANGHCIRVQHLPDDNTSKEKTEVSEQQCQVNIARKDVYDTGTENNLALGREASVGQMVSLSTYKDSNCQQNPQKIGLTGLPLERRASPRLQNNFLSKQPINGSNQKGKLDAGNDNITGNNDQNRPSSFLIDRIHISEDSSNKNKKNRSVSSPKDKITIQKSRHDHIIRELLRANGIDNRNAGSRLLNYENGEIVDLDNYVSPKSLGYKKFTAHLMCEEDGVKMNGTVRALDKRCLSQSKALFDVAATAASSRCDGINLSSNMQGANDFSELPGLVCEDISYGIESMRIPATNLIDPPTAPSSSGFKYINTFRFGNDVIIPQSPPGCNCRGNCTNKKYCSCARLNGSDFPYVDKDGGRLIEPKDVVFECGLRCGCGPSCVNRISQRGLKYQLEVYRTMNKGWAVRSWDFIPSGAFVCEYIGVIRKSSELDNENVSENDFIFQIDCLQTIKGIGGRERRQGYVSKHARSLVDKVEEAESETEFCVDGAEFGNVTRFINHSCDPNLFVQCVLSSHRDIRLARIVLFAADDIPPMQELTYDYGYELDSVIGPDGRVKKLPCYCGTNECRGRLY